MSGLSLVARGVHDDRHGHALGLFLVVVFSHWVEHLVQAFQYYVLGWPVTEASGALGLWFPDLITSEWLHYGYNLAVLAGLALLLPRFEGRARTWWTAALAVQAWHHAEHALLLGQVVTGEHLLGRPVATSVLQLWVPRLELHQVYNAVVLLPLLVAVARRHHPAGGGDRPPSRRPLPEGVEVPDGDTPAAGLDDAPVPQPAQGVGHRLA